MLKAMKAWGIFVLGASVAVVCLSIVGVVSYEIWSDWHARPETRIAAQARAAIPVALRWFRFTA